ncbi:MAG: hypothetical protein DMD96_18350 [Candidatus Rokuibacteriota bacterium]|nr:MAG: hypothetical protein DMD96_18350 [Candidatus Rokubacteria bacterium]
MFPNSVVVGICASVIFTRTASTQYIVPSALLTIGQNRSTVVERIAGECGDCLAASNAGVNFPQSRQILCGQLADHFLTGLQ